MSAMWVIYLADVAQGIGVICFVFGLVIAVASVVRWIPDYSNDDKVESASFRKRYFPVMALMMLIVAIIPSKQTIYMMAAAKVGQDIVTSPETKEISSKVLALINMKLDEQLAEPKKK